MKTGMASPITVTELDHVVLRCRDQPRMIRFYSEVLGLAEERRIEAIGLVQLRAGRSLVDLVPGEPAGYEGANVDHVCLLLAPVAMDDVVRHLAERGVETIGEPMVRYGATGYGLSLYLRDPEGNVVELKLPSDAT
jgi:catechol-2,3-dioxygenase